MRKLLAAKIVKLRVFKDENGKMNRSVTDIGGELLVISQFTLLANYRHGNRRISLRRQSRTRQTGSMNYFKQLLGREVPHVEAGVFGADMQVSLVNDGPVTIVMDSKDLMKPEKSV